LDDQYSIINKRPQLLALSAKRTREKHAASVFNNAFSTAVFAGGDGFALCANAHTWNGTSTTQDNLGTAALSSTSLATARLSMRGFTDDKDNLLTAKGSLLLVPPELEQKAYEITQTPQTPYDANNTLNFIKTQNYKVVVWDYLTDTNNWFLIDERYAKMFLKWFDRVGVEFNKDKDFDTYVNGSFTGNGEEQTDETAGNPLELQLLIAEAEAIANSDNVEDWAISSQAVKQVA